MDYVNFGSAGIKVSQIALGLGLRGQADEGEALRLIERALDLGINFIDCANRYSPADRPDVFGKSEAILGRALKGKRDQVVITSKVQTKIGPGPNDGGSSRVHILREVENSLSRLDTDYIDVYLIHAFDPTTPPEETIRALDDLVHSGKVHYVGCSNYKTWQVCKALWIADRLLAVPFMCVQNPYNLLSRQLEQEMFGLARDQGLGVMVYSPLAVGLLGGMYTPGRPAPEGSFWSGHRQAEYAQLMQGQAGRVVAAVHDIANEMGKTPAQVATAWILSHAEITCAICGSDTIQQLEDSVGALGWTLEAPFRQRLDEVSEPIQVWG